MNTSILPVDIVTHHLIKPRLDVYYPRLAGLVDHTVERKLNERIHQQVETMIKKQGFYENPETEITGGFEIKTNERNIVSLTNSHYSYSGGAHGLIILRSLTMNIQTGKVYRLKELFNPGAPYVERLNNIIREQIKKRDLPLLTPFKGIAPYQYFYLADKALVIYFQLYDLLPYAFGIPYFVIPVYEIQDIIDEDGPLGQMIY
ncbi:DUF3298 and DUF4163 domain-containing protein [Alkalihalophilus lindianensis]|uniref:DUF3298 and DUF4163 domain-containing protein n=1 Tax=Alkalihalophilus lindianensis TaxID=1630542 RepID=A0ABU3XE74_9BACI|nr:DUF3298 and DUF4163 domain-containing protein [Alkalihalophilus lindianensis]MDV2686182.1 DUF3298 and DUF4163 domain-containing protein [Alkalihalophilus lindianensis]